ncbi:MAG: hypothetical protein LBQ57_08745 [Spirochaetales bacterium]|jgi:hypothetical protein|nr:hypothetical protein [Spirochaetales bacterium]
MKTVMTRRRMDIQDNRERINHKPGDGKEEFEKAIAEYDKKVLEEVRKVEKILGMKPDSEGLTPEEIDALNE